MGYQKGVAKLSNGASQTGFIFNGATFVNEVDAKALTASETRLEEIRATIATTRPVSITDIDLILRPPETLRGVRRVAIANFSHSAIEASNVLRASQGAKDSPVTVTANGEVFKRFSAYADDFRVTPKKGLTPGTFGTTAEDAENVKTGRDAVARYALENKQSANKRFTINPPESTGIQRGTVQPAYGEPGGGIEVIFVNGTLDGTVTGPEIIPE